MATIPFPQPTSDTSDIEMYVDDSLDLIIGEAVKLCCSEPLYFQPPFPNNTVVSVGDLYKAVSVGAVQIWQSSPQDPCSEIRGIPGRTVHINPTGPAKTHNKK